MARRRQPDPECDTCKRRVPLIYFRGECAPFWVCWDCLPEERRALADRARGWDGTPVGG